ncbi:MAG: 2-oxo acid dehydrogenase subunit E2 [Anaerolineae bacterium]|nr:2-oxo acid dehydrogenase subunit E2 [Anaerolineae bacterium]
MDNKESQSTFSVVMPRLGLTMTEARITEWLKPEGAWVDKGTPLFVLEHEKASLEMEAPASGYLHILVPVDQVVPILTPIAALVETPGQAAQPAATPAPTAGEARPAATGAMPAAGVEGIGGGERVRATPKARALARRQGLSMEGLAGSGLRGMLTSVDVQAALEVKPVKASPIAKKVAHEMGVDLTAVSGSGPRGQVMRRDVERAAVPAPAPALLAGLTGLRGIIANRLSSSWVERPQVTLTTEADATHLVALRQQLQAEWNIKLSYNAILVKLAAKALQEHPNLNVQLTPEGLLALPEAHIGVAVDTPRGLMVPVVKGAGSRSLVEINDALQGLAQRAIEGRSQPDELSGGTFTITNLGMYEIDAFTPIINPPECAILGVGRIVSKPVGLNGQVVLRDMMALSLSFDHRLVDGAPAARFLQRIKTLIERCFIIGF